MVSIDDSSRRFDAILTVAEESFGAGDFPAAAGLAQVAARHAFPPHAGRFSSPRLERLLCGLAKTIRMPGPRPQRQPSRKRHVLHVLTGGRQVGGDTRFAWRWILNDPEGTHSVAITAQSHFSNFYHVPAVLGRAVERSGGGLHLLRAPVSRPLEQALELRRLCQAADVVVLHLYPYDVVPVLALASECETVRVALVNHADHAFWVGGSVSDLVLHHRRQSPAFLSERRALDPDRSAILPIPLESLADRIDRHEARRTLGYGSDSVLLLTIATAFKYRSWRGLGLVELVTPVLTAFPQAVLIGVGMDSVGVWEEARQLTGGRVQALGLKSDNAALYAAADVYLDSVPFSSITSALEAGSLGRPILACDRPDPTLRLLGLGAPGLDDVVERTKDPQEYRQLLARLIRDESHRRELGARICRQIRRLHMGEGWRQALATVYTMLGQRHPGKCLVAEADALALEPIDEAVSSLYSTHEDLNARRLLQDALDPVPYGARLGVLRKLRTHGMPVHPVNLLPPPTDRIVRSVGHRVNSALRKMSRDVPSHRVT